MYVLNFFGKESFKKDTMGFELMTNRFVGNVWKATGNLRALIFATITLKITIVVRYEISA